jgi:hypothetical protein
MKTAVTAIAAILTIILLAYIAGEMYDTFIRRKD